MTPFLDIRHVRKEYGPVVAVHDVELTIERGEFMTFLGPSGSGKSTTLYILAGFEQPSSGDILLNGKTILDTPSHKRNIGMVFQRYTLFPHLSVGDNIAYPLKVRGWSKASITERVRQMLALVRLEGFEDRRPAQMSGGQQQRVALARALAYDPPVLLMDEPLSALDKKLREEIQYEIRRIHQETEVTILYVTHDQEEALRLSDRIAVFSRGVIDQIGTGAELYAHPRTRFVAEFIGDSDFLPCQLLSAQNGRADVTLPGDVTVAGIPLHGAAADGKALQLMLRPERIALSREKDGHALAAVVEDITFLGNNIHVKTRIGEEAAVSVRLPFGHEAVSGLARGMPVWLSFDPDTAHVFTA
ncbi:branched-chain amino acid ABC transporter substrate-binding protein [Xaviernesmea oryzae]|uniref:Branched-chain amino acid ABC transporter substrate-binding protein n=1 Tax=Xaviernesmea oryzae TaxID=464029 RepID=A0A1Q9AYZ7_9HYPH|nr:ABC transporter ATP-binding protein [Xaviernesmea oryzae]OLP60923.1 branched-chain amino acid ABC transporter substrate-binding protein [Xaviernesmea oryzae]SEL21650.1 putative spermidine/putrescine transport system ATP-binding protein [Xaviernesmea oryzae]